MEKVKSFIRDVPDFPKPGVVFKDITPLLQNPTLFKSTVEKMAGPFRRKGITHVASVESRGFIFGAPVAYQLDAGFIPVRKKGKLPYKTAAFDYELEYGTDTLEIHADALDASSRVLVIDDVLATGGTAHATCKLVEKLKAKVVGMSFVIELEFLHGREKLRGYDVLTLIRY
ncbi:MAG: adenine phosphoribosyltransferase [Elusimicrobia bacterium RIFCSPLOWO2_01_FULL_59_12]|nr:MAG: adenine phosphoribosyltransferase [Elusimicrobia bacterium RIFCSPLOWO2_01_FULL_59_12]